MSTAVRVVLLTSALSLEFLASLERHIILLQSGGCVPCDFLKEIHKVVMRCTQIIGLAKSAAREMGAHGIRVNAVCPYVLTPLLFTTKFSLKFNCDLWYTCLFSNNIRKNRGVIDTAMVEGAVGDLSKGLQSASKQSPLQRMGTSAECAGIIAFLLSDKASYITGTTQVVDGGRCA
jgi:NAD(P)-dependent dehydrogenase (short-subunit alcohol dehydrogenase family)